MMEYFVAAVLCVLAGVKADGTWAIAAALFVLAGHLGRILIGTGRDDEDDEYEG